MSIKKERVCIAGNGPNAYLAARIFLENGLEVTLIDSHHDMSKGTKLLKKFVLKNRQKRKELYSQGIPISNHEDSLVMPIETRSAGGLTNLWGGVFFPPFLPYYKEKYSLEISDFEEVLGYFSGDILFERSNAQDWNNLVTKETIMSKSKVIHLTPQIALNKEGDLWSAAKLFEQLTDEKLNQLNGTLMQVLPNKDNLNVLIRLNDKFQELTFDRLFLACGPIGNAKILANSMSESAKIYLADSGVSYHLTLALRARPQILSQMRPEKCGFYFGNHALEGYYQYYGFSKELIDSLKYSALRRLARLLNEITRNRLGLIILFKNDRDSKFIELNRLNDSLYLGEGGRSNAKATFKVFWNISKSLFFKGVIVSPFFLRGSAGEGAHSAGPNISELKSANSDDALIKELEERIHLLGMSLDDRVLAGPVTFLSLVLTLKRLKALLNNA